MHNALKIFGLCERALSMSGAPVCGFVLEILPSIKQSRFGGSRVFSMKKQLNSCPSLAIAWMQEGSAELQNVSDLADISV